MRDRGQDDTVITLRKSNQSGENTYRVKISLGSCKGREIGGLVTRGFGERCGEPLWRLARI